MSSGKPKRAKRTLDRVVRRESIGRIQSMESEALWLEQNIPHLDLARNRANERLKLVRRQIQIERNSVAAEIARHQPNANVTGLAPRKDDK